MKHLCRLLLWSFLGTAFEGACAQNAERFVNEILSEYRTVDQAGQADTTRDGVITSQEFARSLYQNSDFEGNNDNGVTMNEFVDHYVKHYNISSELALFMFDLLNDPPNDNKITPNDITLRSFLGRDYARVNEYRDALHKWVTQAAERLYRVLTSPHVINRSNDLSPRYDIISNADTNGDGFVTFQEMKEQFQKFSANHESGVNVNRNSWIERNVHSYGADPVTSILTFDYWDRNRDLVITSADLQVATVGLDRNGDGRISRGEYLQYFERGYKLSRRISGKSIQLPKRACPAPWWSNLRESPSMDATRAAMDFDDDFDGWVSLDNVRRWLMLFDTDGDGFLSRNEYTAQQTARYGVNTTMAASMFDLVDTNGDERVTEDDWLPYFKDVFEVSFCDARRSILDLARMAEKFQNIPQASAKRASMQERLKEEWDWFLQNEQASGWMALDPYRKDNYGLCRGNAACYEGEQTKAWGLPGASLWWVRDIVPDWPSNMENVAQKIPGGPLFAEVLPAVLMQGPLPFKRATDRPTSQVQGHEQTPRQIGGLGAGMASQSQPSGGNNFQFGSGGFGQFPNNMNRNKGQQENPLMKQYQRLFNQQQSSFGPQGVVGVTNPMGFNTNERTGSRANNNNMPFGSPFFTDKQSPNFGPMPKEQNQFRTPHQGQNVRPTAQPWSPSKTMNVDATPGSLPNFPMQNQLPQNSQLPFIGLSAYPLVLSLDPSSSMLWRTMTKRREALSAKVHAGIDDKANIKEDTQGALKTRKRRDEVAATENIDENDKVNDTEFDVGQLQWNPMPIGFTPSPFDIWMSWALEKFLWENENVDSNNTDVTNGTLQELNDLENMWGEMGESRDKEHDYQSQQNLSDLRKKRSSTTGDKTGETGDTRHKRWIVYVQRLRRNPYLYAMRNMWPRYYCFPPFDSFSWRYRVRSPYFWYPCYMYKSFPWWQRQVFPYPTTRMWRTYRLAKRSRRDTTQSELVKDDGNPKRAFSFDNWFKNKQDKSKPFSKSNDNRYMSQIPSSTNAWKSVESNKYGMKNNWGQHLAEESRQWGTSTKEETYDYNSNGKWNNNNNNNNNRMPNTMYQGGYSASPSYSSMSGRPPSLSAHGNPRQWGMSRPNAPQDDMPWMDPFQEGPANFAAFLMPSLVGMSWKKRKIENGPHRGYSHRMGDKVKRPNNFPPMSGRMHQNNWKQQGFSPYSDQLSNRMGNAPWNSGNDPSGFYGMFNQGPYMWNRRFIRKSKENKSDQTESSKEPRQRRSVEEAKKYKLVDADKFYKRLSNKRKSSLRVTAWMPWPSWKRLKSKKVVRDLNQNSISPKSKESLQSKRRQRRSSMDTETDRTKRWGYGNSMWSGNGWNWNQWMDYQWNPWYNNYMRFPRESDLSMDNDSAGREKREANEDNSREKRFGMWNQMNRWSGQGNWNGMWNRWNPWYNLNRWNYMRYPRNSASKEGTLEETERTKRSAEDSDRTKRWGYGNPMWNRGWNWNQWMDYQWNPWNNNYMRFPRESDQSGSDEVTSKGREKREADEDNSREKRYGMWNQMNRWSGQGNWNGMWNRWYPWVNWNRWNYMRYPRNSASEEGTLEETERTKRSAEDSDRTKRWGYGNPMWSGNGWNWNQWMDYQWNPWYNNYMRFGRNSEDRVTDDGEVLREKRDVETDNPRQKRQGMWNMMNRWSGQGNGNGMWNPWYPWQNWNRWNYMRYPRNSAMKSEDGSDGEPERTKRSAEDKDRAKRWGYGNPMWSGNGWNWNKWMDYQWNPWYSNYMRFPRESDQSGSDEVTSKGREKREADEDNSRDKRYGMWNPLNRWSGQGNWNGMWNRWNPWYNWNRWNYMRFPRNSDKQEGTLDETERTKRSAEDSDRNKRWGYGNSMWSGNGWNWNQWMDYQWNPWYNNYMRFPRESDQSGSDEVISTEREKREAGEDNSREKRYGMWNQMNRWSGQGNWNGMWNRWYPWYNWNRWNYMRYPRNSASKEGTVEETERTKRSAEDSDRNKRWGYGNSMWSGNGWKWNQWMDYQWNPWYNNFMRFPRESDQSIDNDSVSKEKREADDEDSPRPKRYGMWNQMNHWSGQGSWNGMWNRWNPWYNWNRWNYMRYPRNSDKQEGTLEETERTKRSAEDSDRNKRWGHGNSMWSGNGWKWNQWMDYQWNPWYNNYMRFPRESDQRVSDEITSTEREKREADEDNSREKRFGMWNPLNRWSGQGNWNGMWNPWYPWQNWNRWNYMRYPRNSAMKSEDGSDGEPERTKRSAEDKDRAKRWGYGNHMWSGNGWNWNKWMDYQWNPWYSNYMRFPRESDQSGSDEVTSKGREKRKADEDNSRDKRYGMWNQMNRWSGQGNWNGMWNRWNPWYNWNRWNYMRYPRNSDKQEGTLDETERTKRSAEDSDRNKRWGYGNPMWSGNGWNWNKWMDYQWNPWYNNYMRFPRESDQSGSDEVTSTEREKREAGEDNSREKRYGMWNQMNRWSGQGNWNGMWNRWNPWYNWNRWNYMRYPRNSASKEGTLEETERTKRSAEDSDRNKRWDYGNPMWSGNGWNWNQWMDYQWNPWYNNFMRFPRESDQSIDNDSVSKEKREADDEDSPRPKRYRMWNQMNRWSGQGNWNGMWNRWNPWYNWNRWNYMRYPRNSASKEGTLEETERTKRSAEDSDRNKRWGYGNPMWNRGWNWNQWMDYQWNPWYNNYMRFPRESDQSVSDEITSTKREKREADEDNSREKRFGMWNPLNRWSGQGNWNGMWNRWNPWYNWNRWNYMRYPRNSDKQEGTLEETERTKRSAEDSDRNKRWGYGNSMWSGNGWNWNQWMDYQWNPWYNNYMRFPRESDQSVSDEITSTKREKREADEDNSREKRFGMWNPLNRWSGQGNWNGMWNRWNPWYNWNRWNYMRYPRNSDKQEGTLEETERTKRSAEDSDRNKRWGYGNSMWSGNGWNWNQWMDYQWNPWYNNYMRFPRDSDQSIDNDSVSKEKREADDEDSPRQKRYGMWNQMNRWSGQGNWNGMWNRWNPWYNWNRWNYMRYPRNSASKEGTLEEIERTKRSAEDSDRNKRWGYGNPMWNRGWNWNQWMDYQWNPWYNNYMRFSRESDQSMDNDSVSKEKREADDEDSPRQKRYGMWNQMNPWSGQGNWKGMWNRWNPWYNWNRWNYMRYPRNSDKQEGTLEETERTKRSAEVSDRNKRWGYGNSMWSGNGWNWNQWMDYQWNPWYNNYMRFPRESDQSMDNDSVSKEKREADDENSPRQKRYGMWNQMNRWPGQGNWNGMWNRWNPWYNWNRWNYMRYPRNSASKEGTVEETERTKRSAEDSDRNKRWGYGNPMWNRGWNWNQWMEHQWNPWYNNYMRFPRESDQSVSDEITRTGREKRSADEENSRQKRYGMWNIMNRWPGQGNWNGMWNRWNPWYSWNRWNYMRYPRNSATTSDDPSEGETERTKRSTEDSDRTKRWGYDNPMWNRGWNWNQWMDNQWNPWYNKYMRFPRESDQSGSDEVTSKGREKRDADEDNSREKRFGMWYQMNPWSGQGNWNGMGNRWYPWYNWNRWNYMRYPRNSDEKDGSEGDREKREIEDKDRSKRWGHVNPMWSGNGWNWNQWMDYQWNPWYNNYMRFPRDSDLSIGNDSAGRDKREADDENPRQKRYGMWNQMNPWSGQENWNGMWNRWNPWHNWSRWNYMRYPRNSAMTSDEGEKAETSRMKRSADESDRTKRWGYGNPMWSGNGWNWNQWMDYQWNPWYNNYMRFPRESETENNFARKEERTKRDTSEAKTKGLGMNDFRNRFTNMKKNASPFATHNKFGQNDQNTMKQFGEKKQDPNNKLTRNQWIDESRSSHAGDNSWTTKWRRWMGRDWMDNSGGRSNFPWFGPRSPWMWQGQMWGNPMMHHNNPWFNHGGWR